MLFCTFRYRTAAHLHFMEAAAAQLDVSLTSHHGGVSMDAAAHSSRWARIALILCGVVCAGSAVQLIIGPRPFHLWLTLGGSFAIMVSMRALLNARSSAG